MATLATVPGTITVTNLTPEPMVFGRVVAYPSVAVGVPMASRSDGDKSDTYNHLYNAEQAGLITAGSLTELTDGVASGHTVFGGQNEPGATAPDSLP
jgi:hypothetical protein